MSDPEVVIVGAGLAGLTAAALLTSEGVSVALIEEDRDVGGRLRVLARDGFQLDAGLHSFQYGGSGPLSELNERLSLGLDFIEGDEPGYLLRGKDRVQVPLVAEGSEARAGDGARVAEFFGRLVEADPKEWASRSVSGLLDELGAGEDELIRDYAGALCLSALGRSTDEVSAGRVIANARAGGDVGLTSSALAGGAGALVETLAAKLDPERYRVALGTRVLGIEVGDDASTKVVTTADEYRPAAVIYTGPLQALPELFEKGVLPTRLAARLPRLVPVAGIGLELRLSKPMSDLKGLLLHPDEAIIGRFPSNLDPTLAPEGTMLSSWIALTKPEDLINKKTTRDHIKRLKRVIKRQFPKTFKLVRLERLRVIPTIAGVAPLPKQSAQKIPAKFKGVNNFFMAGDGIGDATLSGAAVSSAIKAAENVIKLFGAMQQDQED